MLISIKSKELFDKKFYHILLKLWKNIRGNFGQTFSYSSKGCKLNIIYTINMVYIHYSMAELVLEPFYYWFVNIFLKIQLSRKLPLAVQNWPCPTLAHPPLCGLAYWTNYIHRILRYYAGVFNEFTEKSMNF